MTVDNWFLSAAHADGDIHLALERTDAAFAAVRSQFGPDTAATGKA
jgi:glutamate-1-semialdehyde 2,1-aminomutase